MLAYLDANPKQDRLPVPARRDRRTRRQGACPARGPGGGPAGGADPRQPGRDRRPQRPGQPGKTLTDDQKTYNSLVRGIRSVGERANSMLEHCRCEVPGLCSVPVSEKGCPR